MNDLTQSPSLALQELSAAYGIEAAYDDIWQRRHTVSSQTQAALLAAMGVDARDDDARRRALVTHRQRAWARWLEPVQVVPQDSVPITLVLTLEAHIAGEFDWRLLTETGEELHGRAVLESLAIAARAQVAGHA